MPLGHPEPSVEPTPRRIRVRLGGHLVADSTRAQLLVQYDPSGLPNYLLPLADVWPGALVEETGGTFTVQAGDAVQPGAARTNEDPTLAQGPGKVVVSGC